MTGTNDARLQRSPCRSRRPKLSAKNEATREFMLTPSCRARSARRACIVRGTRTINFPLGNSPAAGTVFPASCIAAIQASSASLPFAIACSGVSPSDMHPGKSGNEINHPPPSSLESGRIWNGYSKGLFIFFTDIIHQGQELHDVDRLDRPPEWHRDRKFGFRVEKDEMTSSGLSNLYAVAPCNRLKRRSEERRVGKERRA